MTRGPDAQLQRFAQLAWHFNCHIAAMAHPSWLRYAQQAADPAWSAHLLARGGVDRLQDWHLADAASRLWLIDAASLQSLLQAICGLMQRPQLVRAVSKSRRDSLRAQWSTTTWEAANDASAPKLDATVMTGASGDGSEAQRAAARALLGLVETSRRAVTQRARMRLPRQWQDDDAVALPEAQRCNLTDWIARSWLPKRSAAWAWLF
jgi:hypothetical protein